MGGFYRTLSCEKPFKDEYKTFLLISVLNLIISFLDNDYAYNYEEKFYTGRGGGGYFLVLVSNGYVPLDGVAFSGLTIMGLHFYKSY